MKQLACIAIGLFFLLAGCKPEEKKPTKQESLAFAQSLEKDVIEKKMNFLGKNILMPAFTERVFSTDKIKKKAGIEEGLKKGLNKGNYEQGIYQTLEGGGKFSMVKYYEKDNKPRVIFRAYGNGGINYFDMELTKLNNKVGIADMFIYTSGENLSTSMADMISKMMDHSNDGLEQRLSVILTNIQSYKKNEQFEAAKKEFEKLPYNMRQNKMFEIGYLDIVSNISNEAYQKELEKLEQKYGDEPHFQLTLIDAYLNRKEYDKALQAVNKIDAEINTDPFLNYYRGLIYNMDSDKVQATTYFEKVNKAFPDYEQASLELAVLYAEAKNTTTAKKHFEDYKKSTFADPQVVSYFEEEYPILKN